MSSRLGRTAENGDVDGGSARPRGGLSEYTTQRLAELRARRAELEAENNDYKTKTSPEIPSNPVTVAAPPPTTSASSSAMSTSDLLQSYRARRGLSSATGGSTSPTLTSKVPHTMTNGTSSTSGLTSLTGTRPPMTAKPSGGPPSDSITKPGSSLDSSKLNGHAPVTPKPTGHAPATLSSKPSGLSSGSSFSKADYGSSRGSPLEQIKASTVSLNRSNSARVTTMTEQDDDECVGFASLPEQVHRKAVKRGFDFTLMVVGETGLGKSTLVSSLFLNTELYKEREISVVQDRLVKTVSIEKKYMEIEEKGVKLRLTIVDTPGFNDAMDAEQSWRPIEEYINQQFDAYYNDESGLNRKNIKDHRVHCCLYFVSPYGHGLRPIDIQFMKRLHDKVNIVPIIAKADTLTKTEIRILKDKVLEEIEQNRIQIYEFPDCDSDEDEDFKQQDTELKSSIPFAVIGSNTVVEVAGKKVRGRLYPWGVVEVDNPEHCDFSKLRMMLISTHMQDLKDVTRDVHYENFRARHIKEEMTKSQRERNKQNEPELFYKQNLDKYNQDSKLKRDSSPNFESIMAQNELLEEKDEEIRQMQQMILKMQAQLQKSPQNKANGPVAVGLGNL